MRTRLKIIGLVAMLVVTGIALADTPNITITNPRAHPVPIIIIGNATPTPTPTP